MSLKPRLKVFRVMLIDNLDWSSKRLALKDLKVNDVAALSRIYLNSNHFKFTQSTSLKSEHEVADIIKQAIQWQNQSPRVNFRMAIVLKENDLVIGEADYFRRGHELSIGSMGWMIDEAYWSRGFATEVGQVLINVAFNHFGQHRLRADCDSRNEASKRVLEKLGMRHEGRLRMNAFRNGQWSDSDLYGLVRE